MLKGSPGCAVELEAWEACLVLASLGTMACHGLIDLHLLLVGFKIFRNLALGSSWQVGKDLSCVHLGGACHERLLLVIERAEGLPVLDDFVLVERLCLRQL